MCSMFNSFSACALTEAFVDVVRERKCLRLQPLDARVTLWLHCISMHTVNTGSPLGAVRQEHGERRPEATECAEYSITSINFQSKGSAL